MRGSKLFLDPRALRVFFWTAVIVTLCAGLWPFDPHPKNSVSWVRDDNGLRIGPRGIILSSKDLSWDISPVSGFSLELWIQPETNKGVSDILNFYAREAPQTLRLFKWSESTLLLYKDSLEEHREIDIDKAFRPGVPLLIAIVGSEQGTTVYLDGVPKGHSNNLIFSAADASGQLTLGTSAVTDTPWKGELRGMAFYGTALTAKQVSDHLAAWSNDVFPQADLADVPLAIYGFSERSGQVAHDQLGVGPNLYIPSNYLIPHKRLLEWPWRDFRYDSRGLQDISLNIAGFFVLAFFCCAWLSIDLKVKRPVLIAILIGAALSLLIEILQVYLPTRTSSMTDVLMNTAGTILGARAWLPFAERAALNSSTQRRTPALNSTY